MSAPNSHPTNQPDAHNATAILDGQHQQAAVEEATTVAQHASVPAARPVTGATPGATLTEADYDIASYDPLQAHAHQLSASAGFAEAYAVAPVPAPAPIAQPASNDPPATQTLAPGQTVIAAPPGQQIVYTTVPAPAGTVLRAPPPGTTYATIPPPTGAAPPPGTQFIITDAAGNPITVPQTIQIGGAPGGVTTTYQYTPVQVQAPVGAPAPAVLQPSTIATSTVEKRPAAMPLDGTVKRQALLTAPATLPAGPQPPLSVAPPMEAPFQMPDLSNMTPDERRRHERNLREQQRSHKISNQIKDLKSLLTESNIPFKPNKFSILYSVSEYIKQLQSRAIMLDSEHKKLVSTIKQTNDMVNSGQTPSEEGTNLGNQSDMLFVQGIDYKAVFLQCSAALSVAALDGRILGCNREFEELSGLKKEELLRHSLFTLLKNHEAVFRAMGEMLTVDENYSEAITSGAAGESGSAAAAPLKYYSGIVVQKNDTSLQMNITLCKSQDGRPTFFNCAMTAAT